jgi:hypothetical protein
MGYETQRRRRLGNCAMCVRARVYQFKSSKQSPPGYDSFSSLSAILCVCASDVKNKKSRPHFSFDFFPILDVLARIYRDRQSVSKSPGTKTKGLRRSNFASAGSTRPKEGGIKANIPRLREQIASYRVSERKKSLEIGNCTRFSARRL